MVTHDEHNHQEGVAAKVRIKEVHIRGQDMCQGRPTSREKARTEAERKDGDMSPSNYSLGEMQTCACVPPELQTEPAGLKLIALT